MGSASDWRERIERARIRLLPKTAHVQPNEIPGEGLRICCDFYIQGIEKHDAVAGGYRRADVLNIDHHAPTARMARLISSTNLAIEHVAVHGARDDAELFVNHTDCDSVLSVAIVAGLLLPDQTFGEAAIASDHTGERNEIADLLQPLDPWRDLARSLHNLERLLEGRELEPEVRDRVDRRLERRRQSRGIVESGRFHWMDGLAWAEFDERVDGEFFPSLLPEAQLIMMACPFDGRMDVKLRRGLNAPPDMWLSSLGIGEWDPAFGGRWNAGSNNRGGGTELDPLHYAQRLAERLRDLQHR
jgi:hypothetical protein